MENYNINLNYDLYKLAKEEEIGVQIEKNMIMIKKTKKH